MAKKEETIFAEKVDSDLRSTFGDAVWFENIQQASKAGTADRLVCLNGHFIALELKTEVGVASKIQLLKLGRIKRAGGSSYLVTPSNWNKLLQHLVDVY